MNFALKVPISCVFHDNKLTMQIVPYFIKQTALYFELCAILLIF